MIYIKCIYIVKIYGYEDYILGEKVCGNFGKRLIFLKNKEFLKLRWKLIRIL